MSNSLRGHAQVSWLMSHALRFRLIYCYVEVSIVYLRFVSIRSHAPFRVRELEPVVCCLFLIVPLYIPVLQASYYLLSDVPLVGCFRTQLSLLSLRRVWLLIVVRLARGSASLS